jgi:transposase-like protein
MTISKIYKQFPTRLDCIKYLEKVRWNNEPICPYCNSINQTTLKKEHRYHCNNCKTTYSVTVGTIFHKTKIDLQKWFVAIYLILNTETRYSTRQLARDLGITKDSAWYLLRRLEIAFGNDKTFFEKIIELYAK